MDTRETAADLRATLMHGPIPAVLLLLGLYGFVLALTGFKDAWKLAFASESAGAFMQSLLDASLATPFTGLLSGVLITSMIQSSSATIAIVVATVGSGVISVEQSVFVLMGANIGTTITNTIVGLARLHKREEFDRLVPAILVDDLFKLCNVALFFTIEVFTGMLHRLSVAIVDGLAQLRSVGGFLESFPDLIDVVTEPVTAALIGATGGLIAAEGWHAFACGALFFVMLMVALSLMGEALQIFLHDRSRAMVSRVFGGPWKALSIGFVLCWLLQSSSVTVSLILPLVSHAALTLPTVYYYSIGAALATTCDAGQLLGYLKFGQVGLTAGLVHILLNVFGAVLFVFVPGVNRIPLVATEALAGLMCRYRHAPAVLAIYVGAVFFGVPLAVIWLVEALG